MMILLNINDDIIKSKGIILLKIILLDYCHCLF